MMCTQSRSDLAREVSPRYRRASRAEKSVILDEFCVTCGYNRKYAIGVLASPPLARTVPIRRPRAVVYGKVVSTTLANLWGISNGLCSKRLIPFLPELVEALERHDEISVTDEIKQKLFAMSTATADRLLANERRKLPNRGLSTTKPGTLLKSQIPIHTQYSWDDQKPGFFEGDLVAHCDDSVAGEFVYTFTLTDIATGWTECQSLANKSKIGVVQAINRVRKLLPFPMLAIDTDNGSEFINDHLLAYCGDEIKFTRGRPGNKNDQCHVEQKNWTVVRQHVGYARYEGQEECRLLQNVHRWLRLHINFFQPSVKLIYKERDKDNPGRVHRQYDKARTPYQRLVATGIMDAETAADLKTMYENLNPVEVLRRLNEAISRLQKVRRTRLTLAEAENVEHDEPSRYDSEAYIQASSANTRTLIEA